MKTMMCLQATLLALSLAPVTTFAAPTFTTLYAFQGGADGDEPSSMLVAKGGVLFGTTSLGGISNQGTVFQFDLAAKKKTTLYSFQGGTDGFRPFGPLVSYNGLLYGSTANGGLTTPTCSFGCGTLFSVDPVTGTESILYRFSGSDGWGSNGLVLQGEKLYGTAPVGGAYGFGTVFDFNIRTGVLHVLYSFTGGSDGEFPQFPPLYHSGVLYGTCSASSAGKGFGVVYSIDTTTNVETTLYSFSGKPDGGYPENIIYDDGVLYGTTDIGGLDNDGSIFSITLSDGSEKTFYSIIRHSVKDTGFNNVFGPTYHAGFLYGATTLGNGAIFRLNLATNRKTTLVSLSKTGDNAISAPPIFYNGALYGVQPSGGGYGWLYELKP